MKTQSVKTMLMLPVTAWFFCNSSNAQDVNLFYFSKFQAYQQVNPQVAYLIDNDHDAIGFEAGVEVQPGGSVTSATITPPGKTAIALTENAMDNSWSYEFDAEILPDLDAAHPSGTYQFQIQTGNGPINVNLDLTGDNYPNTPRVTNYTNAQAVNSAGNFTLTWNTFVGGTASDYIEVMVEDTQGNEVFHSGPPGEGLDGTDTSVLIPAGTLSSGTTYITELRFIKFVDIDNSSGATGVAAYSKITALSLKTTGTSSETNSPWVENTSPWFGQTDVPVESVMVFAFNEPMTPFTKIGWTGSGLNPANFSYKWAYNNTRLYAIYGDPNGLPQGETIEWELNPDAGSGTMQDAAGNPLYSTQGSFQTSTAAATGDNDVEMTYLVKTQGLVQTGAVPQSAKWYAFDVGTELNHINSATHCTLTTPTMGSFDVVSSWFGDSPEVEAGYTTKAELDQFFPSGAYQVAIHTARDGIKTVNLDMPADNYPNDPTITNIANMAAVDPSQPLTISWGAFSGANSSDNYIIGVYISTDSGYEIYESSDGELNGTSTSVTIPAGTFDPGRTYEAELEFVRIVDLDTTGYPDSPAVAGFTKITHFNLQTTGTPIAPTAAVMLNPWSSEIHINGGRYVSYRLEASTDMTHWFQIDYPRDSFEDGTTMFNDWDMYYMSNRYYRAVEITEDEWSQPPVAIQGQVLDSNGFEPIAGATVGTSLDSNTTTTDAYGNFFLHTFTVREPGQSYSIIINKSGYQPYNQSGDWGDQPRDQSYHLLGN